MLVVSDIQEDGEYEENLYSLLRPCVNIETRNRSGGRAHRQNPCLDSPIKRVGAWSGWIDQKTWLVISLAAFPIQNPIFTFRSPATRGRRPYNCLLNKRLV